MTIRNGAEVPDDLPLGDLLARVEGGWPHAWPAIEAMGRRADAESRQRLRELAAHRDDYVRRSALEAMHDHPRCAATDAVIMRALADPSPVVVREALHLAGCRSVTAALPRILQLLRDPDPRTRIVALSAMRGLADSRAPSEALRLLGSDPSPEVRAEAARCLADDADAATWREAFERLASDAIPQRRAMGARIAARLADASVRERLEALAKDSDGHVRAHARRALARLRRG